MLAGLSTSPSQAATLPPADLGAGQASVSIGLPFVAFDRALSNDLSVGAVGAYYYALFNNIGYAGLRCSYHAARGDHLDVAFTLGGGGYFIPPSTNIFDHNLIEGPESGAWLVPTADLTLSLMPMTASPNLLLRVSAGPWLVKRLSTTNSTVTPLPVTGSLELMVRPWAGFEAGVGFPDLVGMRLSW
ncbi:MAG: hypothetical protein JWM80_3712 [Cyanobacteria bacterium RYN_339]|nr:hypothetical protein [Cyanobacteria bacterium RYN_339]